MAIAVEESVATRDKAARAMQVEGQDEQSGDCSSDSRGFIYLLDRVCAYSRAGKLTVHGWST